MNENKNSIVKAENQNSSVRLSNIAKRALDMANNLNSSSIIEHSNKHSLIQHNSESSHLILKVDARYEQLKNFLLEGQWIKADQETKQIMLELGGATKRRWLKDKEIQKISCEDLSIINQLWTQYSDGRFGFSIQKKLFEKFWDGSKTIDYHFGWCKFGELVGWRANDLWDKAFEPEDLIPAWIISNLSEEEQEVQSISLKADELPLGHYPKICRLRIGGFVWWAGAPRMPWGSIFCALMLRFKECSISYK